MNPYETIALLLNIYCLLAVGTVIVSLIFKRSQAKDLFLQIFWIVLLIFFLTQWFISFALLSSYSLLNTASALQMAELSGVYFLIAVFCTAFAFDKTARIADWSIWHVLYLEHLKRRAIKKYETHKLK